MISFEDLIMNNSPSIHFNYEQLKILQQSFQEIGKINTVFFNAHTFQAANSS